MARQIIQDRTPRQRAFSDVLAEKIGQAAQLGVGAYQQAQRTARQRALEDRKMAMQEAAIEREQQRYEEQQRRQDEALSYKLAQAGVESTGNFEQDMANLSRIGAGNRARSSRLARLKEDEANYLAKQRAFPYEQRDEYKKAVAMAGLKSGITKDPAARLAKMGAEARNKVGSIATGLRALNTMELQVAEGEGPQYIDSSTPFVGSFISDTPYTSAERTLAEVVGRLQSGGAINDKELETFKALGPRPGDSYDIVLKKLEDQKAFLSNKARAFGFSPEEMGQAGLDIGGGQTAGFKREKKKLANTEFDSPNYDPFAPTVEVGAINTAVANDNKAIIADPKRVQFRQKRIQELLSKGE